MGTEATMDNNDTEMGTDSPLERFEAAAVAALRAGYNIDDLTPWLLSAIDTVAKTPDAAFLHDSGEDCPPEQ
jgi:hypothetical protein